jgi:hypothetical protein
MAAAFSPCRFFRKCKEDVLLLAVAKLALQLNFVKLFIAVLERN